MNPARLSPVELARLLSQSGETTVTEQEIRKDLRNGAPANDDGTIHFVKFVAWLAHHVK